MTLMLASVTGPAEAELALVHGADLIDLKDPSKGALGALDINAVRATAGALRGRAPSSAVTGDLPMDPDTIVAAAGEMADAGVDYVKVGLFPGELRAECVRALSEVARRSNMIGVMFADLEPDLSLLAYMEEAGFAGAMLDTAKKGQGRLLDYADIAALAEFTRRCREHRLFAGLAGSLEAPDVPRLLLLAPDYLGFRGALCAAHDRKAGLDGAAIDLMRGLIPQDARGPKRDRPVAPEYGLLAGRAFGREENEAQLTDRVFVHGLVLPLQVGAYAREHAVRQNVRFNVDAEIASGGQPAQDMRDVLSYDVISDGIRLIAAAGHIELVETLAERIAEFILRYPRVQQVTVRIEKLEVGPGQAGVEIRRRRPAHVANVYQLYPAAVANSGSSD